jgi:xanthine dehydrogenase large subunit
MPAVGKNIPHDSAVGHVTGQSTFLDDVPPASGEWLVDFLGSPVAHGRIRNVDLSEAAAIPGVILMTFKDIPGHNAVGPVMKDEHILAEEEVQYIGDAIVLIAAQDRATINRAKKEIRLDVEELPPIFSIDEAIAAGSFIGPQRVIERGQVEQGFAESEHK